MNYLWKAPNAFSISRTQSLSLLLEDKSGGFSSLKEVFLFSKFVLFHWDWKIETSLPHNTAKHLLKGALLHPLLHCLPNADKLSSEVDQLTEKLLQHIFSLSLLEIVEKLSQKSRPKCV